MTGPILSSLIALCILSVLGLLLLQRDLKPQNLLLDGPGQAACLKIADFGFARNLQPQGLAETLCGSPLYMAPEILHFHKYDAKADLWSVGAILFELVGASSFEPCQEHIKTNAGCRVLICRISGR